MNKKDEEEEEEEMEDKKKSDEENKLIYFKKCNDNKQLEEKLYEMYKEYKDGRGLQQRYNSKDFICTKYNGEIKKIGINYPIDKLKTKISNLNREDYSQAKKFKERYNKEKNKNPDQTDDHSDQQQRIQNQSQPQSILTNSCALPFYQTPHMQAQNNMPAQNQTSINRNCSETSKNQSNNLTQISRTQSDPTLESSFDSRFQTFMYSNNANIFIHPPPQQQPPVYILNSNVMPQNTHVNHVPNNKNARKNQNKANDHSDQQQKRIQNQSQTQSILTNSCALPFYQTSHMQAQINMPAQNQTFINRNCSETSKNQSNNLPQINRTQTDPTLKASLDNRTQTSIYHRSADITIHPPPPQQQPPIYILNSNVMPLPPANTNASNKRQRQQNKSTSKKQKSKNLGANLMDNNEQIKSQQPSQSHQIQGTNSVDTNSSENSSIQSSNESIDDDDIIQSSDFNFMSQIPVGKTPNISIQQQPSGVSTLPSYTIESDSDEINGPALTNDSNEYLVEDKILGLDDDQQFKMPKQDTGGIFSNTQTSESTQNHQNTTTIPKSPMNETGLNYEIDEDDTNMSERNFSGEESKMSNESNVSVAKKRGKRVGKENYLPPNFHYSDDEDEKSLIEQLQILNLHFYENEKDFEDDLNKCIKLISKSFDSYQGIDTFSNGPFIYNEKLFYFQKEAKKCFLSLLQKKPNSGRITPCFHASNAVIIHKKSKKLTSKGKSATNDHENENIDDKVTVNAFFDEKNIRYLHLNEPLKSFYQGKYNKETHFLYESNDIESFTVISYCSKSEEIRDKLICEMAYVKYDAFEKSHVLCLQNISVETGFYYPVTAMYFHHDEENNTNKLYLCGDIRVKEFTIDGLDYINDPSKHDEISIKNTKTFLFGAKNCNNYVITVWGNELIFACNYEDNNNVLYIWNTDETMPENDKDDRLKRIRINKTERQKLKELDIDEEEFNEFESIGIDENVFSNLKKIDFNIGKIDKTIGMPFKRLINLPKKLSQISSLAILNHFDDNHQSFLAVSSANYPVIYVYDKLYNNISLLISHRMGITCLKSLNEILYSGSLDYTARLWNLNKGFPETVCNTTNQQIRVIEPAIFENKVFLFTGGDDKTIQCFCITDKRSIFEIVLNNNFVPQKISFTANKDKEGKSHGKLMIISKDDDFPKVKKQIFEIYT